VHGKNSKNIQFRYVTAALKYLKVATFANYLLTIFVTDRCPAIQRRQMTYTLRDFYMKCFKVFTICPEGPEKDWDIASTTCNAPHLVNITNITTNVSHRHPSLTKSQRLEICDFITCDKPPEDDSGWEAFLIMLVEHVHLCYNVRGTCAFVLQC
jgi:hypothetical protein